MTGLRRMGCGPALLLLFTLLSLGLERCTGPRGESAPDKRRSLYRLPWPAGRTHLCVQGHHGLVSHRRVSEQHALDFAMPQGSIVCAARGGRVTEVIDHRDGHGFRARNNRIIIDHGDGSFGHYLHIRRGGARVRPGQRVERGQAIAESGHVGRSMVPHLHFHVSDGRGRSRPVSFPEVPEADGIPRMLRTYTSANPRR